LRTVSTPAHRVGKHLDIAWTVIFLYDEENRFIIDENTTIDSNYINMEQTEIGGIT